MKDAYEDRVRPAMRSSVASARSAAHNTRERVVDEVLPSVTSALGSALAALEIAKTQRVQGALKRVKKAGARADILESKKTGPGRYILAGVALVAVIGVAYAAWQTLREDDGAWIDDEASTGVDEDEL
jgi:cytochrome c-type biogenesis protein CcmH/NrfG